MKKKVQKPHYIICKGFLTTSWNFPSFAGFTTCPGQRNQFFSDYVYFLHEKHTDTYYISKGGLISEGFLLWLKSLKENGVKSFFWALSLEEWFGTFLFWDLRPSEKHSEIKPPLTGAMELGPCNSNPNIWQK